MESLKDNNNGTKALFYKIVSNGNDNYNKCYILRKQLTSMFKYKTSEQVFLKTC